MILRCGTRTLDLSYPNVMGILNVTPDSFSDGGRFNSLDTGLQQAEQMLKDGAHIIDVGGESTRPGAKPVSVQEELDRVIPIVEKIASSLDVAISVDTSTPQVIEAAVNAGAHMLNDVRALQREGAIEAVAATDLPVCLMHMQGQPDSMQKNPNYQQVADDVYVFLAQRIQKCSQAGIDVSRLLVDPGFGFGKTLKHNVKLLAKLESLKTLGVPVLVGMSRKTMIGAILKDVQSDGVSVDRPVDERVDGSVAAAVIAASKGAHIVRVHDVKQTADAMRVVAAVKHVD